MEIEKIKARLSKKKDRWGRPIAVGLKDKRIYVDITLNLGRYYDEKLQEFRDGGQWCTITDYGEADYTVYLDLINC
jgi:hypothetical protein